MSRTRTIGPRNKRKRKKNVRFALANTPTHVYFGNIFTDTYIYWKIYIYIYIYRKLRRAQTGKGLAENLANLGIRMGSKAINSLLGKKLIEKGIENIPALVKYGAPKIRNKNVQRALNSDITNYVVEETQNKAKNKLSNLFLGV